jgi:hypothetical protein
VSQPEQALRHPFLSFSPARQPRLPNQLCRGVLPKPLLLIDRNPKLIAELTEARQRGAVVSITVTVRNPTDTKQRLELKNQETYLLDYAEGKKYELISLQGQRNLELGPNEQTVLRTTFKAPQNASSVAVVIEDIGTFDDVQLAK